MKDPRASSASDTSSNIVNPSQWEKIVYNFQARLMERRTLLIVEIRIACHETNSASILRQASLSSNLTSQIARLHSNNESGACFTLRLNAKGRHCCVR
jgi:hypothetical protein